MPSRRQWGIIGLRERKKSDQPPSSFTHECTIAKRTTPCTMHGGRSNSSSPARARWASRQNGSGASFACPTVGKILSRPATGLAAGRWCPDSGAVWIRVARSLVTEGHTHTHCLHWRALTNIFTRFSRQYSIEPFNMHNATFTQLNQIISILGNPISISNFHFARAFTLTIGDLRPGKNVTNNSFFKVFYWRAQFR